MKRCKNPQCTTDVSDYAPDFCDNHNSENKSTNFLPQFQEEENKLFDNLATRYKFEQLSHSEMMNVFVSSHFRLIDTIVEMVEKSQSPYPKDIFSEPWVGWEKDIDELAKSKGKRIDNISAHYGRMFEKIFKDNFLFNLN